MSVSGSPALCVCVAAACGASAPSEKNMALDFWSMYLADFVIFNDFRAPKPFAAVSQLPAALRLPQKKDAPGFLEHVSSGFGRFLAICFHLFAGFRVPQPFASVSQLPAALRLPQTEKHAPGVLEYVSCGFSHF